MAIQVLVCLFCLYQHSYCFEPITIGVGIGVASLIGAAVKARCYFQECCTDRWTKHNVTGLQKALDSHLVGQHLVNQIVSNAVKKHVENEDPKKALVLSFHGWTGSGKNYVSDIIANHVYQEGTKSSYLHKKISQLHYPDNNKVDAYKDELKEFIQLNTRNCGRSMFVFDEMDKMPTSLSNVLKPYLDYHTDIEGVDYRKSIFIFLSNTGGDKINQVTLAHFNTGLKREDITNQQMEEILSVNAFNAEGGLKNSELILSGLIDFFVPFLPMERKHVRECASAALKRRHAAVAKKVLDCVENELQFFPKDLYIFSKTGCKQVEKKVDGC